jgi:uncharacterized protein YndB with AHSA1/START domain
MTMTGVAVNKSVTVDVTVEKAFEVFTDGIDKWWKRAELDRVVIEPVAGGRWYEIGVDASEVDWGRVITWEPPTRLVLAWQLNASFEFDPEFLTEIEVRFTYVGPARTRVDLEHRNLERYGDARDRIVSAFDAPDGWQGHLDAFASAAETT